MQFVDQSSQTAAFDELHGVIMHAAFVADRVDGDDVLMSEMGGGQRFILEALKLPGIDGGREGQNLQGHAPAQEKSVPLRKRHPCRRGRPRARDGKSPSRPISGLNPRCPDEPVQLGFGPGFAKRRHEPSDFIVAGEEFFELKAKLGVSLQELAAVGRPARLGALDIGQEHRIEPLFKVRIANGIVAHGLLSS